MRYVYFANNRIALEILRWLTARGEGPAALVLHPAGRSKYREEIVEAAAVPSDRIFDGSTLRVASTVDALRAVEPEFGLSVLFDYILKPDVLSLFPRGCLNLHPSLLPYNRGQYPNVWSIIDGTPSGVTLHYIDEGIDTGDIVAQREVPVAPTDTGESLYRRLETASIELFQQTWPRWIAGKAGRTPQAPVAGTSHRTTDVERVDCIDLDRQYRAGDLLNILRARTFPPYRGAYYIDGGCKVYVRVSLEKE